MKTPLKLLFVVALAAATPAWSQPVPAASKSNVTASAESLAQPGFMELANAGYFGFSSGVYLQEPGIWGALLLTTEQGDLLRTAFEETWQKRINKEVTEPQQMKQLEEDFKRRRAEILTSEQVETIKVVNSTFAAIKPDEIKDGLTRSEVLVEKLRLILDEDRMKNLDATRGMKP